MSQEIFKAPNSKRIHQLILQRCHTSAEFRGFLGLKRLKNTFFDSRNIDFSLNPRIFSFVSGTPEERDPEGWSPSKKKKIKHDWDFLSFCNVVLQYTQYEEMKQEELRPSTLSPLGSAGITGSPGASSYSNTERKYIISGWTTHRPFFNLLKIQVFKNA